MTMLQQIKRIFRNNKKACIVIGEASLALRQSALEEAEVYSRMDAGLRQIGMRPKRVRAWKEDD